MKEPPNEFVDWVGGLAVVLEAMPVAGCVDLKGGSVGIPGWLLGVGVFLAD